MITFLQDIPHEVQSFPAHTILLERGKIAHRLFFIRKGVIREWYSQDGNDTTLQFFMEGSMVSSMDSFLHDTPSELYIETIEPVEVEIYTKAAIMEYLDTHAEAKEQLLMFMIERTISYTHLFLSRIKDKPEVRYKQLIEERPELILRIPQHYIASYLGITAVSLSRIRGRKSPSLTLPREGNKD